MGKINFEEYRQTWETGPHWELKKEFLEAYQDDFPEDRLLCLAQAYSNIELMHCSYPEPVMRQIHELSKNLHARKRLQEENTTQGKRSFPEEVSEKPYKFIKFCSSVDSPFLKEPTNECKSSVEDVVPISLVQSHASSSDPEQINSDPATLNEDIPNDCNHLFLIHASPDFPLISKIADKIKSLSSDVHRNTPLEKIELAIEYLDLKTRAVFKFKKYNNPSVCVSDFYVARLYVGDTLIALGRSNNERNAAINAAEYAIEVFRNLPLLPKGSLDQTSIHDHPLLVRFVNEMKKRIADKDDLSSKQIASVVRAVKQKLQMVQESFNLREDMLSPLNHRLYFSDFVIMNVWISEGKSTKKKRANNEATEQGYLKLLEELNSGHKVISQTEVNSDILPPSSAVTVTTQNHTSSSSVKDKDTSSSNHKQNKTSENPNNTSPKPQQQKVFRLNHYLLRNSLEKCFALFDMSEIEHQRSQLTPGAILNNAVRYCHNVLSHEFETITNPTSNGSQVTLQKCFVILDEEIVGTGQDTTTTSAKKAANENALENLRKRVYTIKVKNEKQDGFIITRDQVMNLYESSKVVPESNVGHKMLKMMGWSGGSIGKSGGITEPIEASGQHFHQGLGFVNNNVIVKEFKKKIEALIKDYNASDTVTDMIFSTDFTKEERKQIHEVATKYRLNSNSYGKGNERQIHVKHKNLPINELLQRLVEAKGSLPKYELIDQSDF